MATDPVVILSSDWVDSTVTRTRLGEEPADALQCCETASNDGRDFARQHSAALFAACFGEPELALAIFRRIHSRLLGVFVITFWHPLFREMRRLPAFKDLAKEVGLVAYWRTTGHWGDFARPIGSEDFECF